MQPIVIGISHYHHRRISHPRPADIAPGHERIELMTGGRGWIIHRDDFREVLQGDLIWHIPGDRTVCRNDPDAPYSCLSVNVRIDHLHHGRLIPRVTRWEDKSAVNNFIKEIIHCFHDDQFDRDVLSQYTYMRLLFQARRHQQQRPTSDVPRPLQQFMRLIEGQFHNDLHINQLAAQIGWSSAHLFDQCKQHFDETPLQLLLRQRINYAKERLCLNRDPVKHIARACGFNSSSHFCRSFKQHVGMSPEQFRRSYWGQ